jgi:hypothetical protein
MAVPWPGRSPSAPAQVTAFFGGLDLVEPGVVSTPQWRPGGGRQPQAAAWLGGRGPHGLAGRRPAVGLARRRRLAQELIGGGVGLAVEVQAEDLGEPG